MNRPTDMSRGRNVVFWWLLPCVCLLLVPGAAWPHELARESFAYDTTDAGGTNLNGRGAAGDGWAGEWLPAAGQGLTLAPSGNGGSLTYPGLDAAGTRINSGRVGVASQRTLSTALDFGPGGLVYYLSFLAMKDASGQFRVESVRSSDNVIRWGVEINADGSVRVQGGAMSVTSAAGLVPSSVPCLIVSRFTTTSGSVPDVADVKVFRIGVDAIPPVAPSAWDVTASGATGVTQDRIRISLSSAGVEFDELRLGTSWEDVVRPVASLWIESATLAVQFTRGQLTAITNKLTGESYFGPNAGALNLARISRKQSTQETHLYADGNTVVEVVPGNQMILRNLGGRTNAEMVYDFWVDAVSQDICFKITTHLGDQGIIGAWWGADGMDPHAARLILPAKTGVEVGPFEEAGPGQDEFFSFDGFGPGAWPTDWTAQFAIVQGAVGGFWVRTQDTNLHAKTLHWGRSTNGLHFSIKSHATPPFEPIASFESVEWRIGAYTGDWTVPTDHYRSWMSNAFHLTPKAQREPLWMNDIRFVVSTVMETNRLDVIASRVDPARTLLLLQLWAEEQFPGAVGYDQTGYLAIHWPNPTPTQLFKDFVARAHQLGFRVMPYTLYSSATFPAPLQTWPELYSGIAMHPILDRERRHGTASDLIARGVVPPDYQIYILNPAYPDVRQGLIASWSNLVHETGVDGIYWDFPVVVGFDHVEINGVGPRQGALEMMQAVRQQLPHIALGCENRYNELFASYITFPRDVAAGSNEDERYGNYHPIGNRLYGDYMFHSAFFAAPLPTVDFPQYLRLSERVWKPFGNLPALVLAASVPDWDLDSVGPRYAMEEALALMENRDSRNHVVEGVNSALGAGLVLPGWPACDTNGLVQGLNPARRYALVPGSPESTQARITELSPGVVLEMVRSDAHRLALSMKPADPTVTHATFYLDCPGKPARLFGASDAGVPAVFQKVSASRYRVSCDLPGRVGALLTDPLALRGSTDLTVLPAFSGIHVNGIVTEGRVDGGGTVVTTSSGRSLRSNVRAEGSVWEYRVRLGNSPCRLRFITREHVTAHVVEVNGRELFREAPRDSGGYVQHEVSLSDFAGQPVLISFIAERAEYPEGWYESSRPLPGIPAVYWEAPQLVHDPVVSPDLIAFEPFDFPDYRLDQTGSGVGWDSPWAATTGLGVRKSQDGVSISYPSGSSLVATGSRVNDWLGSVSSMRGLASPLNLAAGNGPYYLSFLARKNAGGAFELKTARSSDAIARWRVRVEANGSLGVGMNVWSNTVADFFENDTTYLVVSKMQPGNPAATLSAKLFKEGDPIPLSEEGLAWDVTLSRSTGVIQDRVELTVSTGTVELDELRIGASWPGVVFGLAPPAALHYEVWQGLHFTEAERLDPLVSGRYAAPAGDGIPNLVKYAFGLDPRLPAETSQLLQARVVHGELQVAYRERAGVRDISYLMETSEDLLTWSMGYPGVEEISRVAEGAFEWVTVRAVLPAGVTRGFLRLAVNEH